jgi:hypothetical protein
MWRSADGMKTAATVLLALALAGIAVVYTANQKSVTIQGPGALQAVDEATVWLGVNDELWVLDGAGRRRAVHAAGDLGLHAAVSNIVLAPEGQALLTSRADREWQVVDRASLRRIRTIVPQWPADFAANPVRALHLAVSPEGDIAVGTGGAHAVLLFDAQGRFKARTAPGTFYFTNGLAWTPEGWWTTDTNRWVLRLLDSQTLAVKRSVALASQPAAYPWLAELTASRGKPLAGTREAPIATVTRVGTLMDPGHAVDIFADGRQAVFNGEPLASIRDIAWFGDRLLVVDGGEYRVRRYEADRLAAEDFGDPQVQAALHGMRLERERWRLIGSRYAFLASAVLLILGIGAYARHKRLVARAAIEAREGGPAAPGPQAATLACQRLWIFGVPIAARLAAALFGLVVLGPWLARSLGGGAAQLALQCGLLGLLTPVVAAALWQQWRHERLMHQPRYESTLNDKARRWLGDHDDFDRVREEGESPRESIHLLGWKPRWLLVTNRRVLLFAASARERRLQQAWPRGALAVAAEPAALPGHRPRPLWSRLFWPEANLVLRFVDGTELKLRCASAVSAARVAQLLSRTGAAPVAHRHAPAFVPARRRWHEVAASLVVPGSGQWLQGRFVTGLVLFTAGLLLCLLDWGPVAWAAYGPKMHVGLFSKLGALAVWSALALAAAADAYHFSAARRG